VFQDLGAAMLKARSPSLSLDRGKKRSKFDTDLRTVDRVDSVDSTQPPTLSGTGNEY